jgi:hypothetical protein
MEELAGDSNQIRRICDRLVRKIRAFFACRFLRPKRATGPVLTRGRIARNFRPAADRSWIGSPNDPGRSAIDGAIVAIGSMSIFTVEGNEYAHDDGCVVCF